MTHPEQSSSYQEEARPEVLPYLPPGASAVLDVGCGPGGFGKTLRARYPTARIVGVEPVASQADTARTDHGFDEVLNGYFPDVLAQRADRFDVITFNDVVEHIIDPWSVVDGLHERLTPDGHVVASIPNVQFVWNLTDLLAGRWDYQDWGILDRTHVRFFTRSTALSLFTEHGFEVETCVGIGPATNSGGRLDKRALRGGLMKLIPDSRWMHFLIVARSRRA
ncbi:class I SAM-dependent methyltransferase [Branchiibius cervicis]|uniref:Class I SAM-dependent methyltransferase n=1 Tax=Branchiibius cervicis TaxID=908252 RepID=A0ABW2AVC1_9MICO